MTAPSPFILVSGFHRSGTSLVAKTLNYNGVNMGDNLMGASFANREGHYEDIPLVEIHDAMLAACGTNWQEHERASLTPPKFLQEKLRLYVNNRTLDTSKTIGAKDPRALLFQDTWLSLTTPIKSLFVFRSWQYSVSSILKRHSRELLQTSSGMHTRPNDIVFWRKPDTAASMWIASAKSILSWYAKCPDSTLIFPLSAIIDGDKKLPEMLKSIGLEGKLLDASYIVKKELLHSHVPHSMLDMISAPIRQECDELCHQLYHAFSFTPRENISFIKPTFKLPVSYKLDQQNHNDDREKVERAKKLHIDFSKFAADEVLEVVGNLVAEQSDFSWEALFKRNDLTAKHYDGIFNSALKLNKQLEAELAIRRALDLQPASWRWMHLGDLSKKRGDLDDAEKCYTSARDRTPENATFYARLAEVEVERNNLDGAAKLILQAKALDSTKPAIANAEAKLAQVAKATCSTNDAVAAKNHYKVMPIVNHYTNVVDAMTQSSTYGQALDRYMVKSAFVLRDNQDWLTKGINLIPSKAQESLVDYISLHADKYWSSEVLRTEFSPRPMGDQQAQDVTIKSLNPALSKGALKIGVHIHVYYLELLPEIYSFLQNIPTKFTTIVTCPFEIETNVNQLLKNQPFTKVIGVENRGRDIAPWLMVGAKQLRDCDVVLKLHTKSTPHASLLSGWRLQLLWSLLDNDESVSRILAKFQQDPKIGLTLPEFHPHILPHLNWGKNTLLIQQIAETFTIEIDTSTNISPFPAGSMFWYKPNALAKLIDHKWELHDFPIENGQIDGTIMHAIERALPYFCGQEYQCTYTSLAPYK